MNRWTWARSTGIGWRLKKLAVGMDLVDVIAKYSELPEGSLATFQITLQAGESWRSKV